MTDITTTRLDPSLHTFDVYKLQRTVTDKELGLLRPNQYLKPKPLNPEP